MEEQFLSFFGVTTFTFVGLIVFWTFFFMFLMPDIKNFEILIALLVFGSAFIIKIIGLLPAIITGVLLFAVSMCFLLRRPAAMPLYSPPNPTAPNPAAIVSPVAPATLYHGTPTLAAARDIYQNNRWRVRSNQPHGIYLSQNFNEAAGYASPLGAVVLVRNNLPGTSVVDVGRCPGNSDSALAMGYRLVKRGTVYIALVPQNSTPQQYYRVNGITPAGLFDPQQNPI